MRTPLMVVAAALVGAAGCKPPGPGDSPAQKPGLEAFEKKPETSGPKEKIETIASVSSEDEPKATKPETEPETKPKAKPGDIPAPADVAAPPAEAKKTDSGLAYRVLQAGTGDKHPGRTDTVEVHYTGWTTDGKMFDSSVKRGRTAKFPLTGVIKGWTEGLQLMVVGEKTRFWIPEELAYKGQPGRPQGMLVFDVELKSITEGPKPVPDIPAPADVAAIPETATVTASGLGFRLLEDKQAAATSSTSSAAARMYPKARDVVEVHYTGWTTDGKMFDSSVKRGRPVKFPLNGVIKGWTEGVQMIAVGQKARLWIPEALAYKGAPGRPAGMLVFDVELLSIERAPEPIPAPVDVAAIPETATVTASGLGYRVLKASPDGAHPAATDRVRVHYTGWTTDGEMFDSSVLRKNPATFPLNGVIEGWTEGVQLMKVGEKARLWIPENLAYKGRRGPPAGMLVFDIELLEIVK